MDSELEIKDMTRQALEQLVVSQKKKLFELTNVIDQIPGSVYWKDRDGRYIGRNAYAIKRERLIVGGTRFNTIGKTDHELVGLPKQAADAYRAHDLKVMETQQELSVEEPVTVLDGTQLVQLSHKKPLYDEGGNVVGVVGNTVDITYLKDIEERLRKANKAAESANIVKAEFIRNMEHDIRTPFSGIWGMAQYLLDEEQDEEKKIYLADIVNAAKELLDYCNDILELSKLESGLMPISNSPFSVREVVESLVKVELPAAKQKGLSLDVDIDPLLPDVLLGDRKRLYRVLINLLSNAIKFTEKGFVAMRVRVVSSTITHATLVLEIEDTGIGIAPEKHEYVFEKFARLSQSNQGLYRGTGLGLRVVKQVLEEMDGKINLESDLGHGSKFICTIPFTKPQL